MHIKSLINFIKIFLKIVYHFEVGLFSQRNRRSELFNGVDLLYSLFISWQRKFNFFENCKNFAKLLNFFFHKNQRPHEYQPLTPYCQTKSIQSQWVVFFMQKFTFCVPSL